jgi:hypothetical protein
MIILDPITGNAMYESVEREDLTEEELWRESEEEQEREYVQQQ